LPTPDIVQDTGSSIEILSELELSAKEWRDKLDKTNAEIIVRGRQMIRIVRHM
jgi:hypothetical protein